MNNLILSLPNKTVKINAKKVVVEKRKFESSSDSDSSEDSVIEQIGKLSLDKESQSRTFKNRLKIEMANCGSIPKETWETLSEGQKKVIFQAYSQDIKTVQGQQKQPVFNVNVPPINIPPIIVRHADANAKYPFTILGE